MEQFEIIPERTDIAVTVSLTKEQVEALLDVLSYGQDYLESRIEDNEATAPRQRPSWWRRDKTTLKHAIAARQAIVMARRD